MLSVGIVILISTCWSYLIWRRALFSFYGFGMIFLTLYSIPVIVGYGKPFNSSELELLSNEVYMIYVLIWASATFSCAIIKVNNKKVINFDQKVKTTTGLKQTSFLLVYILLFILFIDGSLLKQSTIQDSEPEIVITTLRNIFRWSLVLLAYLVALNGSLTERLIVILIILVWLLSGDRTIPVMSTVAMFLGYNIYKINTVNETTSNNLWPLYCR